MLLGELACLILFIILSILNLLALVLLLIYPSISSLFHRSRPLIFLSLPATTLILGHFFLSFQLKSFVPCVIVDFYTVAVVWPIWIITIMARILRLVLVRRFHSRRIAEFREEMLLELGTTRGHSTFSGSLENSIVYGLDELLKETPALKSFSFRARRSRRGTFTNAVYGGSPSGILFLEREWSLLLIIFPIMVVLTGLAIFIQQKFLSNASEIASLCFLKEEIQYFLPYYVLSALGILFVIPFLVHLMRLPEDPHYMRYEVVMAFVFTVFAFLYDLNVAFLLLPAQVVRLSKVAPVGLWSGLFILPAVWAITLRPGFRAIRERILSPNQSSSSVGSVGSNHGNRILRLFENFLQDPKHMRQFKEFSVRDFTIEFPLFYQRLQALLGRVNSSDGMDIHLYEEAVSELWDMFIRRGARFEVRLEADTRKMIEAELQRGSVVSAQMWEKVKYDVLWIMWRETWPRFVREKREKLTLQDEDRDDAKSLRWKRENLVRKVCDGTEKVNEHLVLERCGISE